jgi:hypothetical protein
MDEPGFERPTYASLSSPPPAAEPVRPRRGILPWALVAGLLAFTLGMIANPAFERSIRLYLPGALQDDPSGFAARVTAQEQSIAALQRRLDAVEARGGGSAGPGAGPDGERVARLEGRLEGLEAFRGGVEARLAAAAADVAATRERVESNTQRIDSAIAGAAQGVEQARAVLLVAAARRAVDAGQRLGLLEPALRAGFPQAAPAVEAVVALGAAPITLERLRADFARAKVARREQTDARSWWDSLSTGLATVISVRRSDVEPRDGISAAERRLAAGDVAGAISSLERTPATAGWIANARRYLAGQRGLAQLETLVLTAPAVIPTAPRPAEAQPPQAQPSPPAPTVSDEATPL